MGCLEVFQQPARRVQNQDSLEFIETGSAFVCRAEHVLEFRSGQLLHPVVGDDFAMQAVVYAV